MTTTVNTVKVSSEFFKDTFSAIIVKRTYTNLACTLLGRLSYYSCYSDAEADGLRRTDTRDVTTNANDVDTSAVAAAAAAGTIKSFDGRRLSKGDSTFKGDSSSIAEKHHINRTRRPIL